MHWRITLVVLLAICAGCVRGETEIRPPDIRYGEDICVECNMIISDPRFASAYVRQVAEGRYESLAFDDIGGMLSHADAHDDHEIVAWYVHDYDSEEWLDATAATFVFSHEIQSPMAHGIAAHGTWEAAEQMAGVVDGELLGWQDLNSLHRGGQLEPMGSNAHGHNAIPAHTRDDEGSTGGP
jgi:copper chaperone NosL